MKKFLFLGLVLLIVIPQSVSAVQKIAEVKTFLEDSATQGTPDPNNSFVWPIDLFAENIPFPTSNGWEIVSGSGSLVRLEDSIPNFYWMRVNVAGSPFRAQFPRNTYPALKSRKNHIVFNFRSSSTCSLEVRIRVTSPAPDTFVKAIRYSSLDTNRAVLNDTLLRIGIGQNYQNGEFQTLNRNMETDLKSFIQFSDWKFYELNNVFILGAMEVSGIAAWSRYFYVEGYSDSTSIRQGSPISFKTSLGDSAGANTSYRIDILRAGASGLQLITSSSNIAGTKRPLRLDNKGDSVFFYGTDWTVDNGATFSGAATSGWQSGVYLAKFVHINSGKYTWFPLVVREDNPGTTSKILVSVSNLTWQAHNFWGGESFYFPTGRGGSKTFKRPYLLNWFNPEHKNDKANAEAIPGTTTNAKDSLGASQFFAYEFPFIKWLEGQGYTAEYTDNVHLQRDFGPPSQNFLKSYNSFFSLGHDEYWSFKMRQNMEEEFRNLSKPKDPDPDERATHNLSFLSGNTGFWMANFNSDLTGIFNDRNDSMSYHLGVKRPDNPNQTWYEQQVVGARTDSTNYIANGTTDAVFPGKESHWIFSHTGLGANNTFGSVSGHSPHSGITGYRTNRFVAGDGLPDSTSKVDTLARAYSGGVPDNRSQMIYYEYDPPGEALSKVFSAGAVQWNWGLDNSADSIRRITKNIVEGMTATFTGKITSNMTLSGDIYLASDVTIESTVTVNPGTRFIVFNNDLERGINQEDTTKAEIIVKKKLIVNGTPANPVKFISYSSNSGFDDWRGVVVEHGAALVCSNTVIRNAYNGIKFEGYHDSSSSLTRVRIARCKYNGIFICRTNGIPITGCRVDSVLGEPFGEPDSTLNAGIFIDYISGCGGPGTPYVGAGAVLSYDTIYACRNGIFLDRSSTRVENCLIIGVPDNTYRTVNGITAHEQAHDSTTPPSPPDLVTIENTEIRGKFTGTNLWIASFGRADVKNCNIICSSYVSGTTHRSPVGVCNTTGYDPSRSQPVYLKLRGCRILGWSSAGLLTNGNNITNIHNLGVFPDSLGNNSFATSASDTAWDYIRLTNPNNDSLKAEGNWFGTPDTSRFLGPIKYKTYGHISQNITWPPVSFTLWGDLTIDATKSLKLTPPTAIYAAPNADWSGGGYSPTKTEVIIKGSLERAISSTDSIKLLSNAPTPGDQDWQGVVVDTGSFRPSYYHFKNAYSGIDYRNSTADTVKNCLFQNDFMHGVITTNDNLIISSNTFKDLGEGYGVYLDKCNATVSGNTITNVPYGINADRSYGIISNNIITTTGSYTALFGFRAEGYDSNRGTQKTVLYNDSIVGAFDEAAVVAKGAVAIDSCRIWPKLPTILPDPPPQMIGILGEGIDTATVHRTRVKMFSSIVSTVSAVKVIAAPVLFLGSISSPGFNSVIRCGSLAKVLYNTTPTTVMAESCWWGTANPPSTYFYGPNDHDPSLGSPPAMRLVGDFDEPRPLPELFALSQNYPNPFNPTTTIGFSLPTAGKVRLDIYNILGQKVRTLIETEKPAGMHQVIWNGTDDHGVSVASGIYLYKIEATSFREVKRMVFLK